MAGLRASIGKRHWHCCDATWNCTHIANAVVVPEFQSVCLLAGYKCPQICPPPRIDECSMKSTKKSYSSDAVAEIRQIREEIVTEHGNDLHALCVAAMNRQKATGCKVVNLANRKRRLDALAAVR